MTIYEQIRTAGIQFDNHESDLYVAITPESTEILNGYEHRENIEVFISQIDKKPWYDVPFAYDPWWAKREEVKP